MFGVVFVGMFEGFEYEIVLNYGIFLKVWGLGVVCVGFDVFVDVSGEEFVYCDCCFVEVNDVEDLVG